MAGMVRVPSAAMSQFELEQFERSGDRLRVAGRWSGVRGMRFMRPTLTIGDRRMLAVLDHKPWAPEEGQVWVAEFPWDGDPAEVDPTRAELAVAPSVAVRLSSPGEPVEPLPKAEPKPDPLVAEQERSHRYEAEIGFLREQIELLTQRLAEAERRRGAEPNRSPSRPATTPRRSPRHASSSTTRASGSPTSASAAPPPRPPTTTCASTATPPSTSSTASAPSSPKRRWCCPTSPPAAPLLSALRPRRRSSARSPPRL